MRSLVNVLAALFGSVFMSLGASAQVLTTAETLGRGRQALFVAENHLWDSGEAEVNIPYVQYVRGLHPKLDLYASVGETHILGQDQCWLGIGGSFQLLHRGRFAASVFTIASTGVHRRREAATVFLNSAVVVSVKLSGAVSVWTGVNSLVPIGASSRGLFTPPSHRVNMPLGIGVFHGKWGILGEADLGRLKAVGVGVSRSL